MKKFALKSAVLAIGALATASAFAAVNLDAGTPTPVKYANELSISGPTQLRHGAAADQTATTAFGASFGTDVTAYVRVDIAGGTLSGTAAATAFAVNDSNGVAATVSVAQSGAGYVIFAVTPSAGHNLVAANSATIDTDTGTLTGVSVSAKTGVTLQYRLFETLTAAANPASNNTLKDTGAKSYIAFQNALSITVTGLNAVADVAASPSYTQFTGAVLTTPVAKLATAVDTSIAKADGSAIAAGDILTANSDVTVAGDFNLAKNDAGTYTGAALTRVFLNNAAACNGGTTVNATTLSASTANFTNVAAATLAQDMWACVTAEGTPEISPATYNVSVAWDEQTGYAVTDVTGAAAGTITRNGVRMVAPLAQVPSSSWFVRLALTNSGSADRQFTIAVIDEDTGQVASLANVGTTLLAGKTKVIDLHTALTFAGAQPKRASLVVTVNAPQSEIDGLYQITAPGGTSVSNHILSYKN